MLMLSLSLVDVHTLKYLPHWAGMEYLTKHVMQQPRMDSGQNIITEWD